MAASRCALLFLLLFAGVARADEFSEFRIPEHRWQSLRGDVALSGSRSRLDFFDTRSSTSQSNGRLGGDALWALDSDDLQWLAGVDLSGEGRRDGREESSRQTNGVNTELRKLDSEGDQVREQVALHGQLRTYPRSGPIGFSFDGFALGDLRQGSEERVIDDEFLNTSGSTRNVSTSNSDRDDYYYLANLRGSVGVGRVRDATGVYRAYLLERRLRADGLITGTLSPGARARLAGLFYVQPRYAEVHDLPAKFFWREVEKLLREDGVLGSGTLDAYSLLHALEGYTPGATLSALRQRGYWIAASVSYDHAHLITRQDVNSRTEIFVDGVFTSSSTLSSGFRDVSYSDDVLFGPDGQVRMPIGWRWQVDASGFARFNVKGPAKSTTVGSDLFVRYLIAERWAATGFFRQRHDTGSDVTLISPGWSTAVGAEVAYYFEDGISAGLRISDEQSDYSIGTWYTRDQRVSLTLSYLFSGGLDAPGLIDPVRPLRGGTLNP